MYKIKIIILIISASIVEAIIWGNRICLFILKYFSVLFCWIRDMLNKVLRLHFAVIKRSVRRNKQSKPSKRIGQQMIAEVSSGSIVGGTKTVFITELPNPDEPKPVEIIELPLLEPEEPDELPFPDDDEFEYESSQDTNEIILREMEDALYADGYNYDLPAEYSGGISVEEMADAWKVLNNETPAQEVQEEVIANVLDSLKGTDMFGLFINAGQNEEKAKEIMKRHFEKYHKVRTPETETNFNIGHYME